MILAGAAAAAALEVVLEVEVPPIRVLCDPLRRLGQSEHGETARGDKMQTTAPIDNISPFQVPAIAEQAEGPGRWQGMFQPRVSL